VTEGGIRTPTRAYRAKAGESSLTTRASVTTGGNNPPTRASATTASRRKQPSKKGSRDKRKLPATTASATAGDCPPTTASATTGGRCASRAQEEAVAHALCLYVLCLLNHSWVKGYQSRTNYRIYIYIYCLCITLKRRRMRLDLLLYCLTVSKIALKARGRRVLQEALQRSQMLNKYAHE
jgi:hypothetical protein